MASTYSANLRLELIGTGEQQGTWGSTTNSNLGTLLEQAIGGYESITVSDAGDTTLTTANGSTDQARNMTLNLVGTITAARNVICPSAEKIYIVKNATTGGFAVTFKVTGQTGVSIPNGSTAIFYVDGTDARLVSQFPVPVTQGGTGATASTGTGSVVLSVSPTFTGVPLSTTAAADTNTTQIATTAYVVGQASSTTPVVDGTAAVGTSLRYARADHVHPTDTSRAPLASPSLTGTPLSTTAAVDTNTTQIATTAYVVNQGYLKSATASGTYATIASLGAYAPLASPGLSGTPTAPTATAGTNTTQIATTAFVQAAAGRTLLGTLTMTSGSSQTLSSLGLTSYTSLYFYVNTVSVTAASSALLLNGVAASSVFSNNSDTKIGYITVDLTSGMGQRVTDGLQGAGNFAITNATTSITFSVTGGQTFDAGTILVYGVK